MLAFKAQNTFHRKLNSYRCCNLGKTASLHSNSFAQTGSSFRMSSGKQDQ